MHQFSSLKFFFSHIFMSCDWSDQNFSVAVNILVFRTPDCDNRWCSNYGNTTAIISCRVTVTLQSVHVPVKSIWTGPKQLCHLSSKMIHIGATIHAKIPRKKKKSQKHPKISINILIFFDFLLYAILFFYGVHLNDIYYKLIVSAIRMLVLRGNKFTFVFIDLTLHLEHY